MGLIDDTTAVAAGCVVAVVVGVVSVGVDLVGVGVAGDLAGCVAVDLGDVVVVVFDGVVLEDLAGALVGVVVAAPFFFLGMLSKNKRLMKVERESCFSCVV